MTRSCPAPLGDHVPHHSEIICLVTDRRRADPIAQAQRAVDAAIDLIQVRERDLEAAALASLVRALLDVARGSPTRVVVNDRVDVAIAIGADGVHLRSDSIAPQDARALARDPFLIGRSVHAVDEARSSAGADYLIAGTLFPTPSKPHDARTLGEEGLRRIVEAARVPVLAIGGVSIERVPAVARAGAAGIAAIGLFVDIAALGKTVQALRERFDSAKTAP